MNGNLEGKFSLINVTLRKIDFKSEINLDLNIYFMLFNFHDYVLSISTHTHTYLFSNSLKVVCFTFNKIMKVFIKTFMLQCCCTFFNIMKCDDENVCMESR